MKSTIFFLIFCSIFCQAQNETNKEIESKSNNLGKIAQEPIFPGCEKFVNEKLNSCMTSKLSFLIGNKFEELSLYKKYEEKLMKSKKSLHTRIEYKVSEDGKLKVLRVLQTIGGDDELAKDISEIMANIFENLTIKPAKLSDGTPVEKRMIFPFLMKDSQ